MGMDGCVKNRTRPNDTGSTQLQSYSATLIRVRGGILYCARGRWL